MVAPRTSRRLSPEGREREPESARANGIARDPGDRRAGTASRVSE
jgi:hypothetical protein